MESQGSLLEEERQPLQTMAALRVRLAELEVVLEALPQARGHIGLDYCGRAIGHACDCGHMAVARALGREPKL